MVLKHQKCLDCGLTGDVRLMSRYCHMESIFVHPGSEVKFHPERTTRFHFSQEERRVHPCGLSQPCYSFTCFGCKIGIKRYKCCKSLKGELGCVGLRTCCQTPFKDGDDPVTGCQERYQCCRVNITALKVQGKVYK